MTSRREDAIASLDAAAQAPQPMLGADGGEPLGGADDRSGMYWRVHDNRVIDAVKIALVTNRPLLIEGESGTGKSSLARAVARTLKMQYLEVTIDSQTTAQSLLYEVDVVQRLHEAQVTGFSRSAQQQPHADSSDTGNEQLALSNYIRPGPLWWVFDPQSADERPLGRDNDLREGQHHFAPTVLLLDEIDKADPDVPNNLLGPLGTNRFHVPELRRFIDVDDDLAPLVLMTTNAERDLPPAFLRRCVRIRLDYAAPAYLAEIGRQHLPPGYDATAPIRADELISELLTTLLPGVDPSDTEPSANSYLSTAEFIDGVRAMAALKPKSTDDPIWGRLRSILTGRADS